MKDLFPSYETCVKLRELGFPQNTTFKWIVRENGQSVKFNEPNIVRLTSAPTFAEIWKELPIKIKECHLQLNERYMVFWETIKQEASVLWCIDLNLSEKTLTGAAAQFWIWCKENGHIK